jgi:hypothetical protein
VLLVDEHLRADLARRFTELAPAPDAHVDHRLARFERIEQIAELLRNGLGRLRGRVREHIDQFAAHQQLFAAEHRTAQHHR